MSQEEQQEQEESHPPYDHAASRLVKTSLRAPGRFRIKKACYLVGSGVKSEAPWHSWQNHFL